MVGLKKKVGQNDTGVSHSIAQETAVILLREGNAGEAGVAAGTSHGRHLEAEVEDLGSDAEVTLR